MACILVQEQWVNSSDLCYFNSLTSSPSFQMHFHEWKLLNLDWDFIEMCAYGANWCKAKIGSANDLVPSGNKSLRETMLILITRSQWVYTVKCHYNACHYNANASLTRSILGSQTAPTCPHDHPRVAQHMGYRCEIIAVWSATAAMTPLSSRTNGIKQRYPTCWLCQYSRFMIDLRSNTLIIHLRCSENAINRPIWLPDARMLKTISVAIKLT